MFRSSAVAGVLVLLASTAWIPAQPRAQPPKTESLVAKLARPVKFQGVEDPKLTLGGVLESLVKQYDLSFDINETAFKEDGIADVLKAEIVKSWPIPMMNAPLQKVLEKVPSRVEATSGATMMVRDDVIEITTVESQRTEIWGEYFLGSVSPVVHVMIDKVPLEEALTELARQTERNIVLDIRVGKAGRTPVSAKMLNAPLDTSLRLLADMAGLKLMQIDNVYYVTNKKNAAELRKELEQLKGK
jgi:hypothetical protein